MTSPTSNDFRVDLTQPNYNDALLQLGVTGQVTYGPLGTDAPEGMKPYNDPYVALGWMSDEGLSESIARESQSFTPWQTNAAIRESITKEEFTFSATLWTVGGIATAMRYNVPAEKMEWFENEGYVEFTQGGELPEDFRFRLGIDVLDGAKHRRFWLPNASVVEPSDVTYQKGELVGYPMTWKANIDNEYGYSILRRFKEGWKPGTAGLVADSSVAKRDLGEWHTPAGAGGSASGTTGVGDTTGTRGGTNTTVDTGAGTP